MQAVTGSKVVVLLILGAVKLVFGLAPLIIARNFQTKRKNDGLKNIVGKIHNVGNMICFWGIKKGNKSIVYFGLSLRFST